MLIVGATVEGCVDSRGGGEYGLLVDHLPGHIADDRPWVVDSWPCRVGEVGQCAKQFSDSFDDLRIGRCRQSLRDCHGRNGRQRGELTDSRGVERQASTVLFVHTFGVTGERPPTAVKVVRGRSQPVGV